MSLRSPAVNEKPEFHHGSIQNVPPNPSFPHAFSGNPGGVRMGPRLKHSGVTAFGSRISLPAATFKGGHEDPSAAEPQPKNSEHSPSRTQSSQRKERGIRKFFDKSISLCPQLCVLCALFGESSENLRTPSKLSITVVRRIRDVLCFISYFVLPSTLLRTCFAFFAIIPFSLFVAVARCA
jgi:hypothetical protein